MNKSEFLQIISPTEAAKELNGFAKKMFIMNAFLVELAEMRNQCFEEDLNKQESLERLLKTIDCQIDGMAYSSLQINNMSYNLSIVSDLIENIETSGI